jgi:epoxyqueuosine reductase QueG
MVRIVGILVRGVKGLLRAAGAAVVGSVPSSEVKDALQVGGIPLMEKARSVICFGFTVPEGIFKTTALREGHYWRAASMLYRLMDSLALNMANFLEIKGHISLPLFTCFPQYTDRPRYMGAAQLVPIAVAAGLGGLAKCGLVLSNVFGLRLLIGGIITTADISFKQPETSVECPEDCWECIDACPVKAISRSGKVDHEMCLRHSTSNPLFAEYVGDEALRKKYGFDLLLNVLGAEDHSMYTCIECVRACPKNYP